MTFPPPLRKVGISESENGLARVSGGPPSGAMSERKATPLRDFHLRHGARLVDFAGWDMPVQYQGGILEEHRAVRRAAGLFDVSHMGEADVTGPGAAEFLDRLITNRIDRLYPGRVLYSPMCRPDGGVQDDLLVYLIEPGRYFLCLNAGNIAGDLEWMREQAAGLDVQITDRSSDYALLALQGPAAAGILQTLTGAQLDPLCYYHFVEGTVASVPCLISRTGYTGEDGFELYHAASDAAKLAEALWDKGQGAGLVLAGLGARDSLRLEAGYPLYGHELSREISPLAANLGWTVKFDKSADFIGRKALESEKAAGCPRRVVHFRTGDRRIVRPESAVSAESGTVGTVLSGTLSPILNEAIGTALIPAGSVGASLWADIRGTRVPLRVVSPPLVPLPKR